jgi:type I restriction enzyme S subunit
MSGDWIRCQLGDLLQLQNGFAFDSRRFGSKGMPLVRIRDLKDGNTTETRFDGDYDSRYIVRAGDLLIGMDGEFRCYEWSGDTALLNQRVCRLHGFNEKLLPKFLYYGINQYLMEIEDVTGFATVKHLSSKQILGVSFPLPPLKEQQRIVAILDEAFTGIATATANAEKNLRNASGLFDSKLASIFLQHSKAWQRKTLREVSLDFGRGTSKHRPRNDPKLYGGPYPFVQTGDVRASDHLIAKYRQTYSEAGLAQSKLWPNGTLCITIAANIAETGILDFDACFPDSVIGLVANPKETSNKFLEYLLRSVKAHLQAKGKGSAQDNINLGTFENERFPFPELAIQSVICEELDSLANCVRDLESIYTRKLAALDELKQSLLHQAFTGHL